MRVHVAVGSPADDTLNERLRRQAETQYVRRRLEGDLGLTLYESVMITRTWNGAAEYKWSEILLHNWAGKYRGWWRRAKYGWAVLSDEARDTIEGWLVQWALEKGVAAL